jgi:hypothetical protein
LFSGFHKKATREQNKMCKDHTRANKYALYNLIYQSHAV